MLRTSCGTKTAFSAPPPIRMYSRVGRVFAALYESPMTAMPIAPAITMVRRKPVPRETRVPAAMIALEFSRLATLPPPPAAGAGAAVGRAVRSSARSARGSTAGGTATAATCMVASSSESGGSNSIGGTKGRCPSGPPYCGCPG